MADETAGEVRHDGEQGTVDAMEALLKRPVQGQPDAGGPPAKPTKEPDPGTAKPEPDESPEPDEDDGAGQEEAPVPGDEGDQEGGDQETVLTAPRSWPAEMKAKFAELPRDYQEFILERETQRDREFNRQVQEAAEKRNAANAELQAATHERRQYLTAINGVIGQLAQQTATEFADIQSVADLERLATDDPARYLRWQARRDSLFAAQSEREAALQREQAEQDQRYRGYLGEQRAKLLEKMPELKNPAKAKAISAESTTYLKEIGFDDQEISNVVDHRLMLVVRDALAYRTAQKAGQTVAEKKVIGVPRITRPGAASDRGDRNAQDKAAMTSIARHGTTDQIAAAMTRLLESGN